MGWASGSEIAEELYSQLKPMIKEECFNEFIKVLYTTFEYRDADAFEFEESEDCLMYMYYKLWKPDELQKMLEDY